jgi:hypothetical protein
MQFLDKNINFKKIGEYALIIIVVAVIISIRECTHQQQVDKLVGDISKYSDTAKHYMNKHKEVVDYNKVLEFQNKKTLEAYLSSNKIMKDVAKNYKSINSETEIKTQTLIHDTVLIPFEKKIPCYFKPFRIVDNEPNKYRFEGVISRDGFLLDTMLIFNTQSIIVGDKRVGFFRHETRVEVVNTNPFITTTNIGSFVINPEKKWYNRPLVTFGIGAAIGFGLNSVVGYVIPHR